MLRTLYLTYLNHHVLHTFHSSQGSFHLTQFNTQSTQLNLVVGTTQRYHIAFLCPAGIVARLIYTDALVFYEALGSHLRQVVIARSHTQSTDIQFTYHTLRQFVAVFIDDELSDVEQRATDTDLVSMRQLLGIRRDGYLGRSIGIKDMCFRSSSAQLIQQTVGIFLTATHQHLTTSDSLLEGRQFHILKHARRSSIEGICLGFLEQFCQEYRIGGLFLTGQHQRQSIEECRTNLLQRHIE